MSEMITTRDPIVDRILKRAEKTRHMTETEKNWMALKERKIGIGKLDYPETSIISGQKFFYQAISDGAWKGQRCFIIGGGPSLKGFDFSRLENELTIGINRAYERLDCTIIFASDKRYFEWIIGDEISEGAKQKFINFKGFKIWLNTYSYQYPDDIYSLNCTVDNRLSWSMKDGLPRGNSTGFPALNLAMCLGANPIYLLGFDMKGDGKKQANWHNGYPEDQGNRIYEDFIKDFERIASELKQKGIQVVNLNPDSELKCFEFGNIKSIKPPLRRSRKRSYLLNKSNKKWVVISYYTKGTSYESEIKKLITSLRQHKLPYRIFSYEPIGSWRANLNYKSKTVVNALEAYPDKDVVFVDSDAIVREQPMLFDTLSEGHKYDIAATFHKYSPQSGDADELLSGTLWFQNNEIGYSIARRWHKIALNQPFIRHQKCLRLALEEMEKEGIKFKLYRMPFEYTCIFDYVRAKSKKPVIEHFQASRRFRKEVGYGIPLVP